MPLTTSVPICQKADIKSVIEKNDKLDETKMTCDEQEEIEMNDEETDENVIRKDKIKKRGEFEEGGEAREDIQKVMNDKLNKGIPEKIDYNKVNYDPQLINKMLNNNSTNTKNVCKSNDEHEISRKFDGRNNLFV